MKKLILTTVMVVAASVSLFAQGTATFSGSGVAYDPTLPAGLPNIAGLPGANVPSAQGLVVGLYWAPLSDPDNFTLIGSTANVGVPVGGRYNGGTRTTGDATAPGADAWFIVKAWESSYGASYDAALAAGNVGGRPTLRGETPALLVTTGNPNTVPPGTPGSLDAPGFTVNVPEPSAIALGLLGAGALLLLRRRK